MNLSAYIRGRLNDMITKSDVLNAGSPRVSVDEGKAWHPLSGTEINTVMRRPRKDFSTQEIIDAAQQIANQPICEHGATAYNCKKWGCKFYEIANGRK